MVDWSMCMIKPSVKIKRGEIEGTKGVDWRQLMTFKIQKRGQQEMDLITSSDNCLEGKRKGNDGSQEGNVTTVTKKKLL